MGDPVITMKSRPSTSLARLGKLALLGELSSLPFLGERVRSRAEYAVSTHRRGAGWQPSDDHMDPAEDIPLAGIFCGGWVVEDR